MKSRKVKKLNIVKLQEILTEKHLKIFTPLDIERLFDVSYETARKFILRNVNRELMVKLKKGVYK